MCMYFLNFLHLLFLFKVSCINSLTSSLEFAPCVADKNFKSFVSYVLHIFFTISKSFFSSQSLYAVELIDIFMLFLPETDSYIHGYVQFSAHCFFKHFIGNWLSHLVTKYVNFLFPRLYFDNIQLFVWKFIKCKQLCFGLKSLLRLYAPFMLTYIYL